MGKVLSINSFFSGIGGFDLGFEKMGFKVAFQCEINPFCNSILQDKWPGVPRHTDITVLAPEDVPDADIWCGGFPCQDVSVARGSIGRDGLSGKNSGLFYNFLNLISSKRPKILLIENVTGLLNSHDGKDFKIVIQSLTNLGYGVSWRVFNTRYFGAPQSRPRVYICAWMGSLEKATFALHELEHSLKPANPRHDFLIANSVPGTDIKVPKIAYCLAATSGRHTGTDWSRTYVSAKNRVRRLTPAESEKLQGFPQSWTIPSNFINSQVENLDTLRYHAIGNAVSVPVVVWIADRIKKIIGKRLVDMGMQSILKKFPDFALPNKRIQFFTQLNSTTLFNVEKKPKIKWNLGGMALGDEIIDCKVYPCPTLPFESCLSDIIESNTVDDRYFLSQSAAIGIIRRVKSQNRKLFEPLMKSLTLLAAEPVLSKAIR